MNPTTTRTVFRYVAIAEAISWLGLLIAMLFKWVIQDDPHTGAEGGVPIMGPIHGTIFVVYVVMCLVARRRFRWDVRTTLLALASSIPPFFTIWFETWADRTGRLAVAPQTGATSAP